MATQGIVFGAGALYLTSASGVSIKVGELLDISVSKDDTVKEFFGVNRYAEDIAVVSSKISGKAKLAKLDGGLMAQILGGTQTNHASNLIATQTQTVAASITVTNAASFVADCGVVLDGYMELTKVTSAPGLLEYTAAAGVYAFNASQSGSVAISYQYSTSNGSTLAVVNSLNGQATKFVANLYNEYGSSKVGIKLFAVAIPKLGLAFKNGDFADSDIELVACADSSGNVWTWYEDGI